MFTQFPKEVTAQDMKPDSLVDVLILGTFHFAYPNLDRIKTSEKNQIDFSTPQRHAEIKNPVDQLAEFKPIKIALELKTWNQSKVDSLYREYLNNSFDLPINESCQVGFRLAKLMGHDRIYCVDTWGIISEYFYDDNKTEFNLRDARDFHKNN